MAASKQLTVLLCKKVSQMTSNTQNNSLSSASDEAEKVVTTWRTSALSLVQACIRINNALNAFDKNEAELAEFIDGLTRGNVLTENEGAKGTRSPQLAKLRTIGAKSNLLLSEELKPYLAPDYSTLYQLCVLDGALSKRVEDSGERIEKLSAILEKAPEVTRDYLGAETKREKSLQKKKLTKALANSDSAKKTVDDSDEGSEAHSSSLIGIMNDSQQFDLLLLTPNKQQLRLLSEDYQEGFLEECLPLGQALAESAEKAIVAIVPISKVPAITQRLMPICGFNGRNVQIHLAARPDKPDISDELAIVTARKGKGVPLNPLDANFWDEEWSADADYKSIAYLLYPDLKRRLHVFADDSSEGWTSLIDDCSWVQLPSVK